MAMQHGTDDENTWLMRVWKEEMDSPRKSTRNSSKKPKEQPVVF